MTLKDNFKPGDLVIRKAYSRNLMVVDHRTTSTIPIYKARMMYQKKGVATSPTGVYASTMTKLYGKGLTHW